MTDGARVFPDAPAVRRYSSYLLRCWLLDGGALRVQIEHVQSGSRTQVATLAAALAWLEASSTASRRSRPGTGADDGALEEAG